MVSISCGHYNGFIWCDVIPKTIRHILLGWPWMICITMEEWRLLLSHDSKGNIVLKPISMEQVKKYQEDKPKNVAETQNKPLFILTKEFKNEIKKDGVVYAVLAKEN